MYDSPLMTHANTGYARYYRSLRDFLTSQPDLAHRIVVQGLADRAVTGNFEVTAGQDVLLYSKRRSGGSGKCETAAERYELMDKLQDILSAEMIKEDEQN